MPARCAGANARREVATVQRLLARPRGKEEGAKPAPQASRPMTPPRDAAQPARSGQAGLAICRASRPRGKEEGAKPAPQASRPMTPPRDAAQPARSGQAGLAICRASRPRGKEEGAKPAPQASRPMTPPRDAAQPARWRGPESNRGHHDFQSCALPTELPRRAARHGTRDRTACPLSSTPWHPAPNFSARSRFPTPSGDGSSPSPSAPPS